MSRTVKVSNDIVLSQKEDDLAVILDESIEFDMLTDEVAFGLLPAGTVIALMPHLAGTFQPALTGIVKDGLMLCDGAPIPAGNTLVGTTPNINNSSYLRGASSSDNTVFSSNTRALNVPEIALHGHPVTISADLAPHNHVATIVAGNAPHTHTNTVADLATMHTHPASLTGATDAPHGHPGTVTDLANAPHTHSISVNSGGSHPHPTTTSGPGSASHHHGIAITYPAPGPGVRRDVTPTAQQDASTADMNLWQGIANIPHSHPDPTSSTSFASHTHPITVNAVNATHRHVQGDFLDANALHGHVTATGTSNAPHNHPVTISTDLVPHTHPSTIDLATAPHDHPGTISGVTGSGSILSFEPVYVDCVYVIRVR